MLKVNADGTMSLLTKNDILPGLSCGVAQVAATLLSQVFDRIPPGDVDKNIRLAVSYACDLFDGASEELARRTNIEIERINKEQELRNLAQAYEDHKASGGLS